MSDFGSKKKRRARKEHKCEECARTIQPDESYERYAGVWEGEFYTFVSCTHCTALRDAIVRVDSWFYEGALGGISEWFNQGMLRETQVDFATGLHLTRLRKAFFRQWQGPAGTLTEAPEVAA